jgi:hypothetical protein
LDEIQKRQLQIFGIERSLSGNPFFNYDWRNDKGTREFVKMQLLQELQSGGDIEHSKKILREIESWEASHTIRHSQKMVT